ncbi:uncharacterized protein LOC132745125 [Ruditapes philippinarum]|uniref:uncharacterized protein LOC132745125 n=1 Tax=Ruditapes philippinarum TaxID=129788 RepID=UPI00295BF7A7|nr:uncharacterized protein LOC132745125 [Ruditapes philippinarum]
MDLENSYSYPFVSDRISPDSDSSEYIISWEVLDFDISEPDGKWESIAYCSPVLEAWGRWDPEIRHSVGQALGTFSGRKERIEQIIDYMTGRMIQVTSEDLFSLIRLADMLQIEELYMYCKDRIKNLALTKSNFYKVLQVCSLYGFEHEQIDEFIRCNLIELCKETDILKIDAASVDMLLTGNDLGYWPMQSRFEMARDWCEFHGIYTFFEQWFDSLDLNKMEGHYLNKVVKRDYFVRMAPKCLHRVEDHLTFRTDSSVPFVFILNDKRTGSNVVGLNLEDMNLYRFKFPENMMNATCVPCLDVPKEVLSFEESKRRIYLYDINSGICKKKSIISRGNYPSDISHILETNKRLIIISKGLCSNDDGSARYPGMKKQTLGSVLYQSVNDNGKVIEIEPLMSLAFLVSCACCSQSFIVMSTATHSKRSNLYCFNLETNKMMVINIPFDEEGYRFFERTVVKCLLPVHDKILVLTRLTSILVSIDQETETYNTEISNFTPSEKGNPQYMFVSDLLVELNAKTVRLYRKSKERSYFEMFRILS